MAKDKVISLDFKETSAYESPNTDALPHFLAPPSLTKKLMKPREDSKTRKKEQRASREVGRKGIKKPKANITQRKKKKNTSKTPLSSEG